MWCFLFCFSLWSLYILFLEFHYHKMWYKTYILAFLVTSVSLWMFKFIGFKLERNLNWDHKCLQTNGTLHGYKMTYCSRHLQSIFLLFRRIHKCLLDGIYSFHCSPVTAIAHILQKWKGFLTVFLMFSTRGDRLLLGSNFSCHTLSRSLL